MNKACSFKKVYLISVFLRQKCVDLFYSEDTSAVKAMKTLVPGCEIDIYELTDIACEETDVEDAPVVQTVKRSRNGKPFANNVRCIETGELWESVKVCSTVTGIGEKNIYESARNGWMAGGFHFELLLVKKEEEEK